MQPATETVASPTEEVAENCHIKTVSNFDTSHVFSDIISDDNPGAQKFNQEPQVDIITINTFKKESVKIIFGYLTDYTGIWIGSRI